MTRHSTCVVLFVVCAAAAGAAARVSAQAPPPPGGWVVLTVPDYHALRLQAHPPQPPPDPLPADATVTAMAYELVAADGVAAGRARVTIDVLKDGWVSVPLPSGLHIREARLDDRPLAIASDPPGSGSRRILLSQRGRALVTLDLVVPIVSRAGLEQIVVPASPGGLLSAALTLPRPDVEVTAVGGLIVERVAAPASLRVVTHAASGQPLSLSWQRKRDASRSALPLRLRAGVQQAIGLGEEVGQLTARITVDVVQGLASTLSLVLPPGVSINQVQGAHVADWEASGASLRVTLLDAVDGQVSLAVSGEFRPPPAGRIEIPLLRVGDAERETGGVAVEVLGAGEVTAYDARGLDAADPSDLGELVASRTSPAIVAYRYRTQPTGTARTLALTISRYTPQKVMLATVDEARYRVLLTEDGKALIEARLAVRNNQRSFLGVTLPAGATLWSAAIDGRTIRPGRGQGDSLLLPLQKRRAGEDARPFVVDLVYVDREAAWGTSGAMPLALPSVDVPVSRTGVAIHHSPRFRVTLQPGVFRTQAYEAPLSSALRAAPTLDWRATDKAEGGGVDMRVSRSNTPMEAGRESTALAAGGAAGGVLDPAAAMSGADEQLAARDVRSLVDRFQREARGARAAGVLPVAIAFPEVGPLLYLAAELTPEGAAPHATLTFKRTVK